MKMILMLPLIVLVLVATVRVLEKMVNEKFEKFMNDWNL